MKTPIPFPRLTADEAAGLVAHGETIGFSGSTATGAPKEISLALAARARADHAAGRPFKVAVITGASTGDSLDGALAEADAISWRTPFQSHPALRRLINAEKVRFFDHHLSAVAQSARYGFLGKFSWAIVEVCDLSADGELVLTSSVGASPTFLHLADRVLLEVNAYHPPELRGLHDILEPKDPPDREPLMLRRVSDRIGHPTVRVDPKKIAGVVFSRRPDEVQPFKPPTAVTGRLAAHVGEFLVAELRSGRLPPGFLPVQTGMGNIANTVLAALGDHPGIPNFEVFAEVVQDACIPLLENGRVPFASSSALTLTPPVMEHVYAHWDFFRSRLVLRPQEISNHPELVRRLGVISINTALEVDIFGNVNSTHIMGRGLVNGIGGSGDFTRNAYLSLMVCASTADNGAISAVVPLATHIDHNEHSVQVIVTEHGVADLRNTTPPERARLIVEQCAHPDYRPLLLDYFANIHRGHTPQTLSTAFALHEQYLHTRDMRHTNLVDYFR